jgi:hypothetical protein
MSLSWFSYLKDGTEGEFSEREDISRWRHNPKSFCLGRGRDIHVGTIDWLGRCEDTVRDFGIECERFLAPPYATKNIATQSCFDACARILAMPDAPGGVFEALAGVARHVFFIDTFLIILGTFLLVLAVLHPNPSQLVIGTGLVMAGFAFRWCQFTRVARSGALLWDASLDRVGENIAIYFRALYEHLK